MRFSRPGALLMGAPWLVTFLAFWCFPLLFSFLIGFTDYRLLSPDWSWVGLDNYRRLLSDEKFLASVQTTLLFVFGTIPVTTVLSLLLALLVNGRMRGKGLFRAALFVPSITSLVVASLVFTHLYARGGYVGTLLTVLGITLPENGILFDSGTALFGIMAMDVWMSTGYYMLIFLAGLQSIPSDVYEAASLDGATESRQLFSITLPLLRPVALFVLVINSIKSFQVFIEIFVMTKGKFETSSIVYFVYETGLTTGFEFGYASAAAYLLFLLIGVISLAQFFLLRQSVAVR